MFLHLTKPKTSFFWRLHPSLLSDKAFCKNMADKIKEFFEINDTPEVSDSTLWETFIGIGTIIHPDQMGYIYPQQIFFLQCKESHESNVS